MEGCECRILRCIWDLYQQVDLRCHKDVVVIQSFFITSTWWLWDEWWRCEGSSVVRGALVVHELLLLGFLWYSVSVKNRQESTSMARYLKTLEELEQGSWPCFSYRSRRWVRARDHSPEGPLCTALKNQTPVEVCLLFQSPSCRKTFPFWTRRRFMSLVVHHLRFGWIVICFH